MREGKLRASSEPTSVVFGLAGHFRVGDDTRYGVFQFYKVTKLAKIIAPNNAYCSAFNDSPNS